LYPPEGLNLIGIHLTFFLWVFLSAQGALIPKTKQISYDVGEINSAFHLQHSYEEGNLHVWTTSSLTDSCGAPLPKVRLCKQVWMEYYNFKVITPVLWQFMMKMMKFAPLTLVLWCAKCKQGQYTWKRVDAPESWHTVCLICSLSLEKFQIILLFISHLFFSTHQIWIPIFLILSFPCWILSLFFIKGDSQSEN